MVPRMLIAGLMLFTVGTANRQETKVAPKTAKINLPKKIDDISGYYICKGKEAGGKTYTGVTVIARKKDIYLVQWMVGVGSAFSGVGIRQDNMLAVSWSMPIDKSGVVRGVNLYRIESGPRLEGHWATLPGSGIAQTETLTFLKDIDPDDTR
jgi:hypothetical protein